MFHFDVLKIKELMNLKEIFQLLNFGCDIFRTDSSQ